MDSFSSLSRRRFLQTAGTTAVASILLKGCLGNPPEPEGSTSTPVNVTPFAGPTPETPIAKLGFIPIFEAAPLIIAQAKGFFAKYGMTEVEVLKQANWGAARDNVEIGASGFASCGG